MGVCKGGGLFFSGHLYDTMLNLKTMRFKWLNEIMKKSKKYCNYLL
ncbi:hypothetical protein VN0427_12390 [Helicobacter pylori]